VGVARAPDGSVWYSADPRSNIRLRRYAADGETVLREVAMTRSPDGDLEVGQDGVVFVSRSEGLVAAYAERLGPNTLSALSSPRIAAYDRASGRLVWEVAYSASTDAGLSDVIALEDGALWFAGRSSSSGDVASMPDAWLVRVDAASGRAIAESFDPVAEVADEYYRLARWPDGTLVLAHNMRLEDARHWNAELVFATAEGTPVRRLPVPRAYLHATEVAMDGVFWPGGNFVEGAGLAVMARLPMGALPCEAVPP
jgi:hypothetical protein